MRREKVNNKTRMKKFWTFLLAICLATVSLNAFAVAEGDVFYDDNLVEYEVTGAASCKVTGYDGTAHHVVIPSVVVAGDAGKFKVTSIAYEAFKDNLTIESIVIPKSVTTIEMDAFYNCKMLYKVEFEEGSKLEKINDYSFYYCTGLIDFVVPTWYKTVGGDTEEFPKIGSQGKAFKDVPNITYHGKRTPEKDKYYGWGALNINGIVDGYLVFPEGDTDKKELLLCSTAAKGAIVVPESVTYLRSHAFEGCQYVTSIVIPAGVTECGSNCFTDCTGLTSIICKATTPPDVNHFDWLLSFKNVNKSIPIYVKDEETIKKYKAADGWNQFTNYQVLTEEKEEEISKYTVTLKVNDEKMGKVEGAGKYNGGSDVTIKATANLGFKFVKWSDEETETPRILKLTQDTTITAIFAEDKAVTYKLTVKVNDPAKGYVIADNGQKITEAEYAENAEAIITAVANEGFVFVKWSDGITTPLRKLTMTKDITLTANFDVPAPVTFTITVAVNDPAMGAVTGAGVFKENEDVTLTAVANQGFEFVQWQDGNKDNPRKFKATADVTYTAQFAKKTEGFEQISSQAASGTRKVLCNGQLFILRDGKIYDLTGKELK